MRYLVIGDIHGCYDELQALLDRAALSDDDAIITVGDMVNRGLHSDKVLNFFRYTPQAQAVMGNHEDNHIRYQLAERLPSLSVLVTRWQLGEGYGAAVDYMARLPLWLKLPDALVVHGFLEPGRRLREQRRDVLLGSNGAAAYLKETYQRPWYELYERDEPLIVGHRDYSEGAMRPFVYKERVWCIDTRCVYGGSLTGLLLPEWRFISVPARADHWHEMRARYARLS